MDKETIEQGVDNGLESPSRRLFPNRSTWRELRERSEVGLILAPSLDRGSINRLARLPSARRLDAPRVHFRSKATIVPFEAKMRDHPF